MAVICLRTDRLDMWELEEDDAPFVLRLLNDPEFIQYIGDKGVRDEDSARHYIRTGPRASYQEFGFGLYKVIRRRDGEPIGMCGLLKREQLPDADLGFAFLRDHRARGYALESAAAVMRQAREQFGLQRVVAITSPDNSRSARLLEKLGMRYESTVHLAGAAHEVKLFAWEALDQA